ncbi:MAG: fatty acid desaturase [Thermoanaerobaculaceae bacterium]|jgi:omega-6 fatty acid desaturase (delta-12 desaturase)|nr:fatty acid desaturase [Thermoanaerobaculaceae bacterium]
MRSFDQASRAFLDEVRSSWQQAVAAYESPDLKRSLWQLGNSIVPYLALWALAYLLLDVSYWLVLPVQVLAAGFLVRIFIIFHDCGHSSFFRSKAASDIVGFITGTLVFTPYWDWRNEHARHHATAGDLDRRGFGDVMTMTVEEYRRASWLRRLGYRLYRNPLVMLGIGPLYVFLVKQRFPRESTGYRGRLSVHLTNLALVAIFGLLFVTLGAGKVMLVQLPILAMAGAAGVWLFYVQHQFETVYWERRERRDYVAVAMEGSSLYDLPRVLHWFSGNIGFHHIHHLSPAIPNYRLPRCFREQPLFQKVDRLTLRSSLRSLRLRLYDERSRRLVGFRQALTG